jgi:hypothetical protein
MIPRAMPTWDCLSDLKPCGDEDCQGCQLTQVLRTAVLAATQMPGNEGKSTSDVYVELVEATFPDAQGAPRAPDPGDVAEAFAAHMRRNGFNVKMARVSPGEVDAANAKRSAPAGAAEGLAAAATEVVRRALADVKDLIAARVNLADDGDDWRRVGEVSALCGKLADALR